MHYFLQRHFRCALFTVMVLKCLKYDWNHFEKDITYVQSKSVIKATLNYNNNITVNDVV